MMQISSVSSTTKVDEQPDDAKKSFDEIVQQELDTIIRPNRVDKSTPPNDLISLAFSGGGIRSATFNLGVLQALADADLLKKFDYLSTVSGGGYVGSFFTSMLQRANGNLDEVQTKLRTDNKVTGQEIPEISFLRQYSNYLTPKIGLSTDAFAAISVWFTNTLLNQIVLMASLISLSAGVFFANAILLVMPNLVSDTAAIFGIALMLYAGFAVLKVSMRPKPSWLNSWLTIVNWRWILAIGMVGAMLFAGWLTKLTSYTPNDWLRVDGDTSISTYWLILPVLIGSISLGIIACIGISGRQLGNAMPITSFMREWWGRLGGVTTFLGVAWLLMFVLMLYLPLKLDDWLSTRPFESLSALSVLTAVAVLLGKSGATSGLSAFKIKEKLAIILPWLAILCLLVLVSFGTFGLAKKLPEDWGSIYPYAFIGLVAATIAGFFSWRVDINIFSQHYFYRNRLTRCYLGATNQHRAPSTFTGFDENDDVNFAGCVQKPYHIVNTALNLTITKNLAWQQRKAASFAFTPLNCGFEFPDKQGGYRPTHQFASKRGVKLGSIVAVSGAAASPNMGYHTAPATALLLTMFNVRLGRWYGNPSLNNDAWKNISPPFGFRYLVKELFARSDECSNYLFLSDGGHFENLGIYELVRRRSRLVVAVDVGQDENDKFEDLGGAIRKCQIDLGVSIDMRVDSVRKDSQMQLSAKHYAIGKIQYPDGLQGALLYIKSSLTGDEPADLQSYKKEQPAFPHHSTADQYFDEKQFESYRRLGYLAMTQTINELKDALKGKVKNTDDLDHIVELLINLAKDQINQSIIMNSVTAKLPL
jgi:predicted acylesterase/phospholipase RssA